MAALVIGVSQARPLPFLSGAVNGARAFHKWAEALGYETRLVTDECEPVTVQRLQREFEELLPADASGTHRLLIYFAGHGFIREVEEGLWLLSDWYPQQRAVAVEPLRRRLSRYRVDQVGIFADACRRLPGNIDMADLTPDAVLGLGPAPKSDIMAIDKFIAAQDGTRTFMIPGLNPGEDRCLFSGVLLEALWGKHRSAFSTLVPDKVTSRSLGSYLQTAVPQLVQTYRETLVPDVSPTFPENDDVYFGDGLNITPPDFPPWPPADQLIAQDEEFATERSTVHAPDALHRVGFLGRVAERLLGGRLARSRHPPAPESPREPTSRTIDSKLDVQLRAQERPSAFETHSGFAVDGQAVVGIWTTPDVEASVYSPAQPGWWPIGPKDQGQTFLLRPSPVLIEFANGVFAAAAALPDFIASILATDRGVAALVYREVYAEPQVAKATEEAIGELERGALRADNATDLAVELRHGKHADPVRGAISAYLYDAIGDAESIRRMAYYYITNNQAIPYDIALLAQLDGGRRSDGLLWTTVPAVPSREPRTEKESGVGWTYSATDEATGVVAGFWPWLRQGWAFLDDPAADGSTLVLPGLIELAKELTPARFSTLNPAGGRRLAGMFNLREPPHRANNRMTAIEPNP